MTTQRHMKERVAILGASDKIDRYSYKAFHMLKDHGHEPVLISPNYHEIEGQEVYHDLSSLKDIDTLTIYVKPAISLSLKEQIKALNPSRVILNPGTEDQELEAFLKNNHLPFEKACTLVLLTTDQF